MATSGRPRPSAINHPTRQQLDDLDALMQRMLALPVNPLEELPDPRPSENTDVPVPPPADTQAAVPPLPAAIGGIGEDAAKNGPADNIMQRASQQEQSATVSVGLGTQYAVPSTQYPALVPHPSALGTRYSALGTPLAASPQQPALLPQAQPPAVPDALTQPPRLAWPLRPLLWLNLAFDYGTAWLGPQGRWLRGPSGRALLAWGGLLLLAAALAWVAWDGMAWSW